MQFTVWRLNLAVSVQAKVAEHRKMLKDFDRSSGVRPRLNGWYATHAEQLRNWLGEWLLAKYEQKQQLNRKR